MRRRLAFLHVAASNTDSLLQEAENCAAILSDHSQPRKSAHLREIDPPKTQTSDQDVYAVTQRLVLKGSHNIRYFLWTVRSRPPVFYLGMSLRNSHLQWHLGHLKRYELLPVFRSCEPSRSFKPLVKRGCGQGGEWAENGQAWRPAPNL